jgi:hypothetical protein
MKTGKGTVLVAAVAAAVLFGVVSSVVMGQRSAKERARDTDAMAQRVDQILMRSDLVAKSIAGRSDASASYCKDFTRFNDELVTMADGLKKAYDHSQKLLDCPTVTDDPMLERDVDGMRQQLDGVARDLENTLQYMEHMTYQLNKSKPSL